MTSTGKLPANLDERYQDAFRRRLHRRQERRIMVTAFACIALAVLALMILRGGDLETQKNAEIEHSEERAL
jgi:hypothetical protein